VRDRLGLGLLQLVVDRVVDEALQELQIVQLLGGQALELGRVARGEGKQLVDVHPDDMLGVDPSLEGGHDGAGVVAVRAIAVIAEPPHQLGPRSRGPVGVPARLAGGPGEGEAGQRRDHHIEGVGRLPTVAAGVGERRDEVEVLQEGVGPAVAEDQRRGLRLGGAEVQEVDRLPVDLGDELRVGVEPCLPGAPVVVVLPVVDQVADIADRDAVLPARRDRAGLRAAGIHGELVGPAGPGQPVGKVVQVGLGDLDAERANLGVGHDGSFGTGGRRRGRPYRPLRSVSVR
jgi:hypothetical protein